jgi:hypothetical protein
MDQSTIDRAVKIATRCAMNGIPVRRVTWIPPQSATSSPNGVFAIEYEPPHSASERPSWEG